MRKFVIERTVPGAGGMTNTQLAALPEASNEVLDPTTAEAIR